MVKWTNEMENDKVLTRKGKEEKLMRVIRKRKAS